MHVLCACVGPGSRRCGGTARGSCFVCVCRSRIAEVGWDGQRIMFCVRVGPGSRRCGGTASGSCFVCVVGPGSRRCGGTARGSCFVCVSVQDRGGAVGRPEDHVLCACRSRIAKVRWDGQRIMFCVRVSVQDRGGAVGRPADHVLCACVGPGSRRCGGTASGSCFVCVCRSRIAEVRWDGQRIMFCVRVSVQDRGGAVGRPADHVLCACVGPGSRRCGGTASGSCFVCVCRSRIAEVRWDGQRIMFCVRVGPGSRRCGGTASGSCFVCVCRSRIAEVRWDGQRIMFCVRVGPGSRRCGGTVRGSSSSIRCSSRRRTRWITARARTKARRCSTSANWYPAPSSLPRPLHHYRAPFITTPPLNAPLKCLDRWSIFRLDRLSPPKWRVSGILNFCRYYICT